MSLGIYGTKDDLKLRNMLYDISKIKCQLLFINKSKDFHYFEVLKQKIISHFSILNFAVNNLNKKLLLHFFEISPLEIPSIQLENEINISLYFAFDLVEKRERILSSFKEAIEKDKENSNIRSNCFFFLVRKSETIPKENSKGVNNVFFSFAYDDESLMNLLYQRIIQQIYEYVKFIFNQKDIFANTSKIKDININIIQKRCSEYLQIQSLDQALRIVNKAIDAFSGVEEAKWKEIKAIILSLKDFESLENKMQIANLTNKNDFQKSDTLEFTSQIIDLFESAINKYKKEKQYNLLIEANLRLFTYYSYLNGPKISKVRNELANLIYNLIHQFVPSKEFVFLLKISSIYRTLHEFRKAKAFIQYALLACFENKELFPMVPFIFDEISKDGYVYDSSKIIIKSEDEFYKLHRQIIHNNRKPIMFYLKQNGELKETYKKKYDKKMKLIVMNHRQNFPHSAFLLKWLSIQKYLYLNIIQFYSQNNKNTNAINRIKYTISYLQSFINYNSEKDEQKYFNSIISDSMQLQEKICLNLSKIPILMRIIPLSSEIKFDSSPNPKKENSTNKTKIFLYNPWEKEEYTNYYWTANSFQKIKVQLYNPLTVELLITKIFIEFKGIKPLSYPSSILISPKSSVYIICKIQLTEEGMTNIIGLKYEIVNIISKQYVDNNGNGLYFNFENLSEDTLNIMNNQREVISLSNIKIYPEIPLLNLKLQDKLMGPYLELFEHQYHTFSFVLENKGAYDVDELTFFVYVYKRDNYKITLDEIKVKTLIKVGKDYIFNYKYLHINAFKKIEFRLYYVSYSKNAKSEEEDDFLLKPYLYYMKSIETLELMKFSDLKIIPKISCSTLNQLCKIDKRIKNKHNYSTYFCSQKQYLNFIYLNRHQSALKINLINTVNNEVLKEELCEPNKLKEISFLVDSSCEFDKIVLKWQFVNMDNCQGKVDLKTIFPNFNFSISNEFTFDINIQKFEDEGRVNCNYIIKNNKNIKRYNLKMYLYLYQTHNVDDGEEFEYNETLNKRIFYNGSLVSNISILNEKEGYNYDIDVFPFSGDILNTTCVIVDNDNKNIYMSPISKIVTL